VAQAPPAAVVQMMADDAASAGLGIELVECSPGRAVTRMLRGRSHRPATRP
jgi:hypothetical protein